MLITFSSQAYENITMLGDVAKQLLSLMGHSGTVPGALVAKEIPDALSRLESALKKTRDKTSSSTQDEDDEEPQVSLAQRAFPLINMFKAAIKHESNVMWE